MATRRYFRTASQTPAPITVPTDEKLITVPEAAAWLNVSVRTIYEGCERSTNRMPHYKVGKFLRFSKEQLAAWAQRQDGDEAAMTLERERVRVLNVISGSR
jgi:excisionase family DNA binding protein